MSSPNGYFEAWINQSAYRPTQQDRELMVQLSEITRQVLPGSQVRWAGSQAKGTAIQGSDLDVCVESAMPVTEAQRRDLRAALQRALGRPAVVLSHAVRLPAAGSARKVDIAFANAAFGSRPLPAMDPFRDRRARQAAVRALKLWASGRGLPHLPGWVAEALVVHLDAGAGDLPPLDLFRRVIGWLAERATPGAIEGVLRPAAFPRWNEAWSPQLPGRLTAFQNHARALLRRSPAPETWQSAEDVGRWLSG
jgi:predicted nucleotidyltransferase